jgi:hypothetical protein
MKASTTTLVIWIALISVVGIVLILVLEELDVFQTDLSGFFGNLFSSTGTGLSAGLGAIGTTLWSPFKAIGNWISSINATNPANQ